MSWYRIRLSDCDYRGGETWLIRGAFMSIYISRRAPRGMALLCDIAQNDDRSHDLYLTPIAAHHSRALISAYSARPCKTPRYAGLELLSGDTEHWNESLSAF